MSADRDIRRLNKLLDVSSTGIADGDVPTWDTNVSSFTMAPGASAGFDLTIGGNSTSGGAGFGLVSSGTMTLAGGTNITLSQDGNAVTIMGGAGGGTQTFIGGISASNTVYTSGTVNLVATGGGITVGSDVGQKVLLSVDDITGSIFGAGNTTFISSGTYSKQLSFRGDGIVSVLVNNQLVRVSATQSEQTQNVVDLTLDGNTSGALALISSGTATLAGGSNITLSQAGNAITIVGAAGGGGTQTAISGIVASNATYTSGTVTFTGVGGGVTVGSNTGQRVDISVAAPVAQTNQSGSVFAVSNTFGTSSGTYDARTLSIAGVGAVNVAASNSGWRISAPAQTNQAGSVYASSNTFGTSSGTYDARSLSIAGSGAVSVAASNSGWVISAPAQSVQTQSRFNLTVGGNSTSGGAGFIQISSGVMTLAGGPNITVSQDGNAVSISAPAAGAGQFSAGVSNLGNTSGSTGVTGTRLVFAGVDPITLTQSTDASGATISVDAPSAGTISMWPELPQPGLGITAVNTSSLYFVTNATTAMTTMTAVLQPMAIPAYLSGNVMRWIGQYSFTSATTTANYSFTAGNSLGIYTLTGNNLSLLSSFSNQFGLSYRSAANSTNASASWSNQFGSGNALSLSISSSTNAAAATAWFNQYNAAHILSWGTGATSMSPGQYWAAWAYTSSTAGANLASMQGAGFYNTGLPGQRPLGFAANQTAPYPLMGQVSMTQTDTAMPVSIATADVSVTATAGGAVDRMLAFTMMSSF